jgi:hypothetical protein
MSRLQVLAIGGSAFEYSVFGGGGIPVVLSNDASVKGFNGNLGIGITTFFSPKMGIHVGAEFGLDNVNLSIDSLNTVTSGLIDANNFPFELHTTLHNYNEISKKTVLNIPIMLHFRQNLDKTPAFYAIGGLKISLQHQVKYKSSIAMLRNAAYYPEFDNWAATQEFANLGTHPGNNTTGNFKVELHTKLALELGLRRRVGKNGFLYTGVFIDYGLDPAKNYRQPLQNFIMPDDISNLTLLTFSDKIHLMTIGVKLRLAFSRPTLAQQRRMLEQKHRIPCPPFAMPK